MNKHRVVEVRDLMLIQSVVLSIGSKACSQASSKETKLTLAFLKKGNFKSSLASGLKLQNVNSTFFAHSNVQTFREGNWEVCRGETKNKFIKSRSLDLSKTKSKAALCNIIIECFLCSKVEHNMGFKAKNVHTC